MNLNLSRLLYAIILFCLFADKSKAQSGGNATYFQPTIFPSAPNTAAFAKFGSYPVNMYTGVPEISIPLYTIESGSLKVPVTLSYHASGIRVADAASWVGLGWALDCGGSITRKVLGIPDDDGYLIETKRKVTDFNLQNNSDLDYVRETVEDRQHDNLPDIYSYQLPGANGRFFLNGDSSFKATPIGRSPVSIVSVHGYNVTHNFVGYNQKFTITDEHGTIFNLGGTYQELTGTTNLPESASAWMLETMISQNRRDTVSFTYSDQSYQLPDGMTETISVEDNAEILNGYGVGYTANTAPTGSPINNPASVKEELLNTVYFKNGKIVFVTDTARREDIHAAHALDTIKIFKFNFSQQQFELQKSIVFVQSYFNPGGGPSYERLRLDGLQILDKAGSITDQYYFSYNTAVTIPPYTSLARDYWGYYNGKDNSTDLIPQTSIQMIYNGGTYNINIGNPNDPNCRAIDTTKMQAGVLTSIKYPTGGHTDFTYETNRYFDSDHHMQLAGGLRIHSIASYADAETVTPIVKTYQYDQAYANFAFSPSLNMAYGLFVNSQTYRDWISLSDPNDPDHIGGYTLGATKRVRRYFSQPNEDLDLDGVPVAYTQVTEYTGSPTANAGKSVRTFTWTASTLQSAGGETGQPLLFDYSFSNGKMLTQKDYMHKSDGTYQLVKSVTNTYGAWPGFYYDDVGTAMGQRMYNDGALAPGNSAYYGQEDPDDEQTYPLGDFAIQSGDVYLTSTTTNSYDLDDTTKYVTTVTNNKYDNIAHQQVTRTYHTDSKGDTLITRSKFPADYPAGNPVIDTMVNRNMQAEVIEKYDTLKNAATGVNAVTGGQLNKFKYGSYPYSVVPSSISTLSVGSPLTNFVPSTVSSGNLTADSRYTQMISFDAYDSNNNMAQYTPRNSTPTSIIWDYNGELPVAQIKNAAIVGNISFPQVDYTSFEAPRSAGIWSYAGTPIYDVTTPSGKMSYPLSSGSVTASNFDSNPAYTLSLVSNGAAPTVVAGSSLTGTALRTAKGWTWYEYTVPSGSTSITISGTMSVDELRLYPQAAQMTTYTYDPSGLRSTTDAKGEASYFDYDPFQRLKNARDMNGNIIKNYDYHNYDMVIGNDAIAGDTVTRDNCPSGYAGQSTTYSVPANKYYAATKAAANAEAQYEVRTLGQLKADNPAICGCDSIPVPTRTFTFTNSTGVAGFDAVFSGTNQVVHFPATGSVTADIPIGNYTVTIGPSGSGTYTFSYGDETQSNVHYGTFTDVISSISGNATTFSIQ